MNAIITPTRPAVPAPRPPVAATCGACNGDGGTWETTDGSSPGKTISRWVACPGCGGKGTV